MPIEILEPSAAQEEFSKEDQTRLAELRRRQLAGPFEVADSQELRYLTDLEERSRSSENRPFNEAEAAELRELEKWNTVVRSEELETEEGGHQLVRLQELRKLRDASKKGEPKHRLWP
jgi:hypothetical protein